MVNTGLLVVSMIVTGLAFGAAGAVVVWVISMFVLDEAVPLKGSPPMLLPDLCDKIGHTIAFRVGMITFVLGMIFAAVRLVS